MNILEDNNMLKMWIFNIREDDAAEDRPDDVPAKIGQLHWPGFVETGRAVVREELVDDDLPKSRYRRHLLILSIDDNQLVRDIISEILVKDV